MARSLAEQLEAISASSGALLGLVSGESKVGAPALQLSDEEDASPAQAIAHPRRILAEQPTYNLPATTSLWRLCVAVMVSNYEHAPIHLDSLPPRCRKMALSSLPSSIRLDLAAKHIADEAYWKRRVADTWPGKPTDPALHSNSWRCLFFERRSQELLENHCRPQQPASAALAASFSAEGGEIPGRVALVVGAVADTMGLARVACKPVDHSNPPLQPPARPSPGPPHKRGLAPSLVEAGTSGEPVEATPPPEPRRRQKKGSPVKNPPPPVVQPEGPPAPPPLPTTEQLDAAAARAVKRKLLNQLDIASPFVESIRLQEYPSRMSLTLLLDHLPHLKHLEVCYCVRGLGVGFRWEHFGAHTGDISELVKALRKTTSLQSLSLPTSRLDGELTRRLCGGILVNESLTKLVLPHNRMDDLGARAIARVLQGRSLLHLDIADNNIGAAGAMAIGEALSQHSALESLNMRLNHVGEDGGKAVLEGAANCPSLKLLNLAGNGLQAGCGMAAVQLIQTHSSLETLDLSCNVGLSDDEDGIGGVGAALVEAVRSVGSGSALVHVDVRMCRLDGESEDAIRKELSKRAVLMMSANLI